MKSILTLIAAVLITGLSATAQKEKTAKIHPNGYYVFNHSYDGVVAAWHGGSDTLEIGTPLKVHFIKIGDHVYQISEPAPVISEYHKPTPTFFRGGILNLNPFQETIPLTNGSDLPLTQ